MTPPLSKRIGAELRAPLGVALLDARQVDRPDEPALVVEDMELHGYLR